MFFAQARRGKRANRVRLRALHQSRLVPRAARVLGAKIERFGADQRILLRQRLRHRRRQAPHRNAVDIQKQQHVAPRSLRRRIARRRERQPRLIEPHDMQRKARRLHRDGRLAAHIDDHQFVRLRLAPPQPFDQLRQMPRPVLDDRQDAHRHADMRHRSSRYWSRRSAVTTSTGRGIAARNFSTASSPLCG